MSVDDTDFKELNADQIHRQIQKKGVNFSLGSLKSLLRSDFVIDYNPFIKYFESLDKWQNNDPDYIQELSDHVKVKERERFDYHFKKHLVRTVACALKEGSVNKQCFTLIGGQNAGKSTFVRFLCPQKLGEYIAENIGTDKDSLIALSENLIINLDELATLSKYEINSLKIGILQRRSKS